MSSVIKAKFDLYYVIRYTHAKNVMANAKVFDGQTNGHLFGG